jgi:hypothetical protein
VMKHLTRIYPANSKTSIYNFNKGDIHLSPLRKLEEFGLAESFHIKGEKLEQVMGTITIENGHIKKPKKDDFKWTKVNKENIR